MSSVNPFTLTPTNKAGSPTILQFGKYILNRQTTQFIKVDWLSQDMIIARDRGWITISPDPLTFVAASVPIADASGGQVLAQLPVITTWEDVTNAVSTMTSAINSMVRDLLATAQIIPDVQQQLLDVQSRLDKISS